MNTVSRAVPATISNRTKLDPQAEAQLLRFWQSAQEFLTGFTPLDDSCIPDPDTNLSLTQMLSLVIGFIGVDANTGLDDRTYTLVYTDEDAAKSNYQTVAVPDYRASTPLRLVIEGDRARVVDRIRGGVVVADTRLHASVFGASSFYYSRMSPNFEALPTAAIVSPYSTCAGGCLGCSRGAVGSFASPPNDFVEQHVGLLATDYNNRGWSREDLTSVNITTGCQPDESRELLMMLKLMKEYRRQGFTNAQFHVFSYNIAAPEAMTKLLEAGAVGFVGTTETINDAERIIQWGGRKGSVTFSEHIGRYRLARKMGFPIVESNYVLGADSHQEMLEGIATLDANGVAVVPNIKRNYTATQLSSNHEDLWSMGASYIHDGFMAALSTYPNGTIKRRAARSSMCLALANRAPRVPPVGE